MVNYEYDLRGNKTYEGGSTYPVRYTYDIFGNKTSMTTYRNEASGAGDTTTWSYDEASVVLLSKTYADGKGLTYTYTDDGNLAARNTRVTNRDIISESPFRFSSEFHDDALALVYYNYRHYNAIMGRWGTRDPLGEVEANIFGFIRNNPENDNDAFGLSCCGETIYDAKTHCCVNNKDLIKKAKTCIAKIYLGHFGGRSVDETAKSCKTKLEKIKQQEAKDQTFVTRAYITCFAKKMNEQREADGEIITPSHTGERTITIVQPFPKLGTPPISQVNVNLDKEIENATWRLAELKDAGCCENIELKFLGLDSAGDDSSVNAWFNDSRNRYRMQTAGINLEKNVRQAQNRIKKARRDK